MKEDSLATEIFKELKSNAKRWFIIAIVELVIIIVSNIGWIIYESQYETLTEEEQYIENIDNSTNSSYTQTIN